MTDLQTFLHRLFTINAKLCHDDEVLLLTVSFRFPNHIAPPKAYKSRIVVWRSKYNTGQLGKAPKCFAFKYLNGVPVNSNNNPLTDEQIQHCQSKFQSRFVLDSKPSGVFVSKPSSSFKEETPC